MKRYQILGIAFALGMLTQCSACALLTYHDEAAALECAKRSNGTDSAICDCYSDRGLPIPEDMR